MNPIYLDMTAWPFMLVYAVLTVVPGWFIWHKVYKDGVLGRMSLGSISLFAFLLFAESAWGKGNTFAMTNLLLCLVAAFAVFICWHLYRFHSRYARAIGAKPCGQMGVIGCPYGEVPQPVVVRRAHDMAFSLKLVP